MKRTKIILAVLLVAFVFSITFSLSAEEEAKKFKGDLKFGYRFVDTSGAYSKYKEDINLTSGAYLHSFNLSYTPEDALKTFFDRLDINVRNLGIEPFQSFDLTVQKYGSYKFKWERRKSTYFYADQTLFDGQLYDYHTFDFDRTMDSATFTLEASKNIQLFASYFGFTKKGMSVTTQDINRLEFEFDKPIEEKSDEIAVGVDVRFSQLSFVYEARVRDYENTNSYFLPGATDGGESARYPSSLSYFYLDQPYDLNSFTNTFKLNARPIDSLLIKGIAQISDLDMDLDYSEDADGVNYLGRPFDYSMSGTGKFERKIGLYELDLTYLVTHKLAVIGAVRSHNFKQEGSMTIDGETMTTNPKFSTLGIEAGLQYQFSSKFGLTFGYRNEKRKLDSEELETVDYEDNTTRNGLFGNLQWTPSRMFNLTFDYQHGSYDNPYTLASPMSFNRFKTKAKVHLQEFYGSAAMTLEKSKNDLYNELWESNKNMFNLRAGYHDEKIKAFAGLALINVKHSGNHTVEYPPSWSGPGGTFLWEIMYEGKSTLWDFYLDWDLNEQWSFGAYANFYKNSGFWEIKRNTFKAFIEYAFPMGLAAELAYRVVDYKEAQSGFNDYKANIFEISFGYRWDK
jgi:hypothetical protein